jgi:hypothetical protein
MNVNVAGRSCPAWSAAALVVGGLLVASATGCKTGTAGMKPSWWTFGGGPKEEASKLAAAPSFNGGTEKPSASAKPYPTTTTPNGYVLNGGSPTAGAVATAEPPAATAPVTYGVTPPPAKADPVAIATAPAGATSAPTAGSLSAISPQVGPYATLPSEPPAAPNDLPPVQAISAAAPAATGAAGYGTLPPPPATPPDMQRVADARGAAGWPAQQPASVSAGSRYESATGSRFGGGGSAIDQALPPPAAAAFPAAMPAALEPLPAASPSAVAPLAVPPQAPASGFPAPPAAGLPSAAPASVPPPRRPDPVYRPGGTSSYRPNRAILVADAPEAQAGDVRTVGFDAPVTAAP